MYILSCLVLAVTNDDQPIWIQFLWQSPIECLCVWQQNKFELSFFIFAHRRTTTLKATVWVCTMRIAMCMQNARYAFTEIGICVTLLFFIRYTGNIFLAVIDQKWLKFVCFALFSRPMREIN